MMKYITLDTERMSLCAISPTVYEHVFLLQDDEAMKFLGFDTKAELELERERFKNGLCTYNKSFLYFQLIEKSTDKIIGWCGYHTWYLEHDRAELGYELASDDFKRKGFMSEAIPPILEYGFSEMNLHRIEAFASPENVPSVKLLRMNNFKREGLMKEHYLKDGIYEDSEVFALLKNNLQ